MSKSSEKREQRVSERISNPSSVCFQVDEGGTAMPSESSATVELASSLAVPSRSRVNMTDGKTADGME